MNSDSGGLQAEICQNQPFRSIQQEAFLALLRTSDVVKRRVAKAIESKDLSFEQYNVMRILRGAGAAGLGTLETGARMIEQSPAMTRLIDKLEAKGWVTRQRCERDRRKVYCRISEAGEAMLATLDEPVHDAVFEALKNIDQQSLETLIELLEKIRSAQ